LGQTGIGNATLQPTEDVEIVEVDERGDVRTIDSGTINFIAVHFSKTRE
jgi:hypothetical protein